MMVAWVLSQLGADFEAEYGVGLSVEVVDLGGSEHHVPRRVVWRRA
jgi:hypothetical protein